jgi:hypothetical protein
MSSPEFQTDPKEQANIELLQKELGAMHSSEFYQSLPSWQLVDCDKLIERALVVGMTLGMTKGKEQQETTELIRETEMFVAAADTLIKLIDEGEL